MLSKEEVLDRYRLIRNYTVKQTGPEVADLEKHIREIATSHVELIEKFEKIHKKSTETINVLMAELEVFETSNKLIGAIIDKIAK